jgi:uncharacterized protein YbdZ (MbtH family)
LSSNPFDDQVGRFLALVDENWTDIRPRSLREQMGGAAANATSLA